MTFSVASAISSASLDAIIDSSMFALLDKDAFASFLAILEVYVASLYLASFFFSREPGFDRPLLFDEDDVRL